ncbi:MAG: hypothetical protein ACI4AA_08775 [Lachnospiraceae bacterium]
MTRAKNRKNAIYTLAGGKNKSWRGQKTEKTQSIPSRAGKTRNYEGKKQKKRKPYPRRQEKQEPIRAKKDKIAIHTLAGRGRGKK